VLILYVFHVLSTLSQHLFRTTLQALLESRVSLLHAACGELRIALQITVEMVGAEHVLVMVDVKVCIFFLNIHSSLMRGSSFFRCAQ